MRHHGNSRSPSRNEPSALSTANRENTQRQKIRFCVRQTCTQISNKTFPSHLCAPQIKNHNSSLIVTSDHRTQTIVADKKKRSAHLVINCVPQKLNFYTQVRNQHFHGKYQPEPKKHTQTVNARRSRHWLAMAIKHFTPSAKRGIPKTPFSSLHFSRAVSHDMPSSAAVFQVATVTKPNLTAKICFTAKLVDIPLARTQRATSRGSSVPACTVDGHQDPSNHVQNLLGQP